MLRTDEIHIRDPFILTADGKYHLFGSTYGRSHTEYGFDYYVGESLTQMTNPSDSLVWSGPYPAFRQTPDFWGLRDYWAPEVHAYNGDYYIFATFTGNSGVRGVGILRSARLGHPFAPWSDGNVTPSDSMCLDGTLHIDCEGKPWMVYCHEWVQIGDGTVEAIRLSDDLRQSVGEPVTLFSSTSAPWSAMCHIPEQNYRGWITDGCFVRRLPGGALLILWSCLGPKGYCQNHAVSRSGDIVGPWEQAVAPFYDDDGGHGMLFETLGGDLMLVLHKPNKGPLERPLFFVVRETAEGIVYGK